MPQQPAIASTYATCTRVQIAIANIQPKQQQQQQHQP
jgi:hypothetical protein